MTYPFDLIYGQSLILFIVIATGHSFILIYTYNLLIVN